ncbi:MAG: DEAD/DEAH box helicase [Sterolibacteriaceae bacterium]|nr:DEAD/DEAH box helicase [Sterolibacteriaceae bacterium]
MLVTTTTTFADLGLDPSILKALADKGYTRPTPVQERTIPLALAGTDLLVSSQTGSGKTAAFMLPCLHRLSEPAAGRGIGPRVLVLTPTRELALQVQNAASTYGRELRRLRCATIVGGASYTTQLRLLSKPVDVVVATPGRLIDHLERGRIDLSRVETLILDEADRMLDMGFIDDIESIIARVPQNRQTMLFSATLEGVVGKLAQRVTRNAQRIEITSLAIDKAKISQRLHFADSMGHKTRLLDAILKGDGMDQALVFTSTKRAADDLSAVLRSRGYAADALHGDMNQGSRNRTLRELREGRTRVLVATDVAARGIDVPGISHVINFDLPKQVEDYVHRIGRTGRAGREGVAVSLAMHAERHRVRLIERFTDQPITVGVIAGLEPTERPRPAGNRPGERRNFNGKPAGSYGSKRPANDASRGIHRNGSRGW